MSSALTYSLQPVCKASRQDLLAAGIGSFEHCPTCAESGLAVHAAQHFDAPTASSESRDFLPLAHIVAVLSSERTIGSGILVRIEGRLFVATTARILIGADRAIFAYDAAAKAFTKKIASVPSDTLDIDRMVVDIRNNVALLGVDETVLPASAGIALDAFDVSVCLGRTVRLCGIAIAGLINGIATIQTVTGAMTCATHHWFEVDMRDRREVIGWAVLLPEGAATRMIGLVVSTVDGRAYECVTVDAILDLYRKRIVAMARPVLPEASTPATVA
jgi:hypothetical protein